jgi:ABC-type transporter Mla MlaB component
MTELSPGSVALKLTSATIRTATTIHAELVAHLDESGTVKIDGGAVERIDTAILQLLAAYVRDVLADGRTVEWVACSSALRRAARALGLELALELPADTI